MVTARAWGRNTRTHCRRMKNSTDSCTRLAARRQHPCDAWTAPCTNQCYGPNPRGVGGSSPSRTQAMPADTRQTIRHPRDATLRLSAGRTGSGELRLLVNGTQASLDATGGRVVTLADGSRSTVRVVQRWYDIEPSIEIDGVPFEKRRLLSVGALGPAFLPMLGILYWVYSTHQRYSFQYMMPRTLVCTVLAIGLGYFAFRPARRGELDWIPWVVGISGGALVALLPIAYDWWDVPTVVYDAASSAVTRLRRPPNAPPPAVGTAAHIPVSAREVLTLRAMLFHQRWDEAIDTLAAYEAAARADVVHESRWWDIYEGTFGNNDQPLHDAVEEWVAARPNRAEPRMARAAVQFERAFYWRGTGPGRSVRKVDAYLFETTLYSSAIDATMALARDSTMLPAYWYLMRIARAESDQASSRAFLDRALRLSPASLVSFRTHMLSLVPPWGGSIHQMEDLVEEIRPLEQVNPELRTLEGYPEYEIGRELACNCGDTSPLPHLRAAQSSGADVRFYETVGDIYWYAHRNAEAGAAYDSAIALTPFNGELYNDRYSALQAMVKGDPAGVARLAAPMSRDSLIGVRLRNGFPELADTSGLP